MYRFFQPGELVIEHDIELSPEEAQHAIKVLRLKSGEKVEITNGVGKLLQGHLEITGRSACKVLPASLTEAPATNPEIHIALAAIRKKERMEWFIEKAVELGVSAIHIFSSANTEKARYDNDRLNKIAISALKQSGNLWLPEITAITAFEDLVKKYDEKFQKLIAYCPTGEEQLLKNSLAPGKAAVIFIGPEGDFNEEEIEKARKAGFMEVNLGKLRLRAETAALASLLTFNIANQ